MKRNILLLLLGAVALLSACSEDRLEIDQKGVISMDSFYKTEADAENALMDVYGDLAQNIGGNDGIYVPYTMIFNLMGDDVLAAGEFYGDNDQFGSINEFRHTASNNVIETMYKRFYWSNYHANLIINKFSYGDNATINRCISEARVIRAWIHMMTATAWGTPPLITELLEGNAQPANYEGTHEEMLKWCAQEAGEAAEYLDERASTADKDGTVKVTKGFAWAVQGKALVMAGDYANAKTALKKVIDSQKYALVPGSRYGELFHAVGDGCEEKIFEINHVANTNIGDWNGHKQRSPWMQNNVWNWRSDRFVAKPLREGLDGWGGCAIPEDFAEEFIANDGNSPRRKASIISYDEFIHDLAYDSDKRIGLYDTTYAYKNEKGEKITKMNYPYTAKELTDKGLTYEGIDLISSEVRTKDNDFQRGIGGTGKAADGLYGNGNYLMLKLITSPEDLEGGYTNNYTNFMIMRYAEVLLLYAEACIQSGDGGQAAWAVNQIRERAELGTLASVDMNTIKREKKIELWLEGCRWADIMRWKDTEAIGKLKNIRGKNIPSLHDEFTIEGKEGYQKYHKAFITYSEPNLDINATFGYKEGKHEYYPYPANTLIQNPGLTQNPGW